MSNNASITPERFLPVFTTQLWHNIRTNDFGVSPLNSYCAIITLHETILCTMDFLGRINPDKSFRSHWGEEYYEIQDRLLYIYLNTLHNCMNRLTLARMGVPVSDDTFDLVAEDMMEYGPKDYHDEKPAQDADDRPGFQFDAPQDKSGTENKTPEKRSDLSDDLRESATVLCPAKLALLAGGVTALAAILLRKRR